MSGASSSTDLERRGRPLAGRLAEQVDQQRAVEVHHRVTDRAGEARRVRTCRSWRVKRAGRTQVDRAKPA